MNMPPSSVCTRRPPARRVHLEPLEARIAPAFAGSIDLSSLNGFNGFKLTGQAQELAGLSISDAGDVNGDGITDLIVGAAEDNGYPNGALAPGSTYVVFGKATGFSANLNLGTLNGTNGFRLRGEAANDLFGRSVSSAGDVNGDGLADLLVGAPGAGSLGGAYVIFGASSFGAVVNVSTLNGTNGFQIDGAGTFGDAGFSVSRAGDFNGDGYDDVLISTVGDGSSTAPGHAYVAFGKASGFGANLNLSSLNGTNGFRITGETGSGRFYAVSGGTDLNRDGLGDLVIGGDLASPNGRTEAGAVWVVFGKRASSYPEFDLGSVNGTNGYRILGATAGDSAGVSVSTGDVNGDQFPDVIVGAQGADPHGDLSGAAYVVFSQYFNQPATVDLATLNGTNGFRLTGANAEDRAGASVASGDVNGDGYADVIVGAYTANPDGPESGAAYVVFGKASPFAASFNLGTVNGVNGFRLDGAVAFETVGSSVGAADLNADGFADVLVGAPGSGANGPGTNSAFVVFGGPSAASVNATLVNATTATYTDVDGDLVTIKVTKGSLSQADFTLTAEGIGARLEKLNFSDDGTEFQGTGLTITATKRGGGDGFANIGFINAAGIDLGAISLTGDLGHIIAGDANTATAAVAALKVQSLGHDYYEGPRRGASFSNTVSLLQGSLKDLSVKGTVWGSYVKISGGANGDLTSALIAGELRPKGYDDFSGTFQVSGDIGKFEIKASLQSAQGNFAGSIIAGGTIGQIAANGSLSGGIVIGGTYQSNFSGPHHGIFAGKTISKVSVGGEFRNDIVAVGNLLPTTNSASVAIGSVTVGISATRANILAGYDLLGKAVNPDAAIGTILVGNNSAFSTSDRYGDWSEGNIVAGVTRGADGLFGTADDARIAGGNSMVAKIASIVLRGQVFGTTGGVDHFGFVAEKIAALQISGSAVTLTPGPDDVPLGTTGDFNARDFV